MIIRVLIDNVQGDNLLLQTEHGLSFYIEDAAHRILCDMGASEKFLSNAEHMGVNLSDLSFAFISHGHADHTGGMMAFLMSYENAKIYLSNHLFDASYFSSRRSQKRNISTDGAIKKFFQNRLCFLETSTWITPHIAAVYTNRYDYSQPYGNSFLTKCVENQEKLDDFNHELSLAIRTSKGLVIISSCSHGGVVNILQSCCHFVGEERVYAFVGGLHLVESEYLSHEVKVFGEELRKTYPEVQIYTGHCTCDMAKEFLKKEGLDIHYFQTGGRILI